jgi:hypothetical protein
LKLATDKLACRHLVIFVGPGISYLVSAEMKGKKDNATYSAGKVGLLCGSVVGDRCGGSRILKSSGGEYAPETVRGKTYQGIPLPARSILYDC